ncbi:MAG: FkbM family methyltransferase [Terriglobia bacterium]|nr:FkbM family methyltransferase [Terriglobia bacterium]
MSQLTSTPPDWGLCILKTMLSTIKRVFGTASRILRDEGVDGLTLAVREWLAVRPKYVELDGCTFVLRQIPNTAVKLLLTKKEYEGFERRAVREYVRRSAPIVELGGCLGVVACITNRALEKGTSHVVVEANPRVISLIEENRTLNGCNFELLNAAIAYGQPTVTFCPSFDMPSNSLRENNGADLVTVNTVGLGDIIRQRNIDSFTLICDIEGHEYDLVQNESEVLKHAEIIILETHARMIGEAKNAELLDKLREIGFEKIDEEATVVVLKRPA